jgi:hypothetical protein
MPHTRKVCACRREQKSTSAAQPRAAEHLAQHRASLASVVPAQNFGSRFSVGSEYLQRKQLQDRVFKQYQDGSSPRLIGEPFGVVREPNKVATTQARSKLGRSAALRGRRPESALPNPSLKLSPNGVPPGPRGRAVYHRPRGPGVTPSVPAYLERWAAKGEPVQCSSKVSACRRELNSHEAAKPQEGARKPPQVALHESLEGNPAPHRVRSTSPSSTRRSYKAPPCHIVLQVCVGISWSQPVRRAAAAIAGTSGLAQRVRRLECVACQRRGRGAGGTCGGPHGVTTPWLGHDQRFFRAALPNPSLKPSPNGGPPGPRGAVVYPAPRGPGVPPSGPS